MVGQYPCTSLLAIAPASFPGRPLTLRGVANLMLKGSDSNECCCGRVWSEAAGLNGRTYNTSKLGGQSQQYLAGR